jgi:hypothetical protein
MATADQLPTHRRATIAATKSTNDIVNEAYHRLGGKYNRTQIRQCFLVYLGICQIVLAARKVCNVFSIFKMIASRGHVKKWFGLNSKKDG